VPPYWETDGAPRKNHQSVILTFVFISRVIGWLGSRVVRVLDSGAEGPGFKSQLRCFWVTVLGKLFTPIVPLFTKQHKKLSYRRVTARCVLSVVILPITTQQYRNYLYDKS